MDKNFTLRLDDQLCFALYAATNAMTRSYRGRLDAVGLTYPQYLVMLVLWQDGPAPISHIAARLGLAPNAITPLLDKLEKSALVKRKRDDIDRRVIRIELTKKGTKLEHDTALKQHQVVCDTGLTPHDLNSLRQELRALVERMEGEMTPPPVGRVKQHNPVQPAPEDKFLECQEPPSPSS